MTRSGSYTFTLDDMEISDIPQTWLHYLNGPNAGFIGVDWAREEMPWLVGIPQQMTFRSVGSGTLAEAPPLAIEGYLKQLDRK
jgi:hypothetical protein